MKKWMNHINEFIFGKRAEPVCAKPKIGWKTTCHGPFTTFGDWCQEFRVGMLHDRKILEIPYVEISKNNAKDKLPQFK